MYFIKEVRESYNNHLVFYKGYRNVVNFPKPFKIWLLGCSASIVLAVVSGVLLAGPFFSFLAGIVLFSIGAMVSSESKPKGYFQPMRQDRFEEKIKVHEYRSPASSLVDCLKELMTYEELDGSVYDRQLLASEIFNLVKLSRISGAGVKQSDLAIAESKLKKIKTRLDKQRKELKLAGLSKDTPLLDAAAELEY